jgi:hypothetical protein
LTIFCKRNFEFFQVHRSIIASRRCGES